MSNDFDQTDQELAQNLDQIFTNILTHAADELKNLAAADLGKFWYFSYDYTKTAHWNLYDFTGMLDIYKRKCRQWEEIHNPSLPCVVERVRDTYLMPKIKEFLELHNQRVASDI